MILIKLLILISLILLLVILIRSLPRRVQSKSVGDERRLVLRSDADLQGPLIVDKFGLLVCVA